MCVRRPLFDTYGHRIDFGEGEWPSVWPSEIEQDEFQGWHFLNGDPHAGSALAASSYASGGVEDWSNASYTLAGGDDQAALAHYSAISSDAESSIVGMPTYHGQPSLDSGEAGWTKHWDEQYQREFYYHQVCTLPAFLPPLLAVCISGSIFCVCCLQVTGASSWERPLEYQSPRYSGQPVIATGNNGWTKHYDEMYFADFYHNEFTGETTWDRPQEYSTPRQDDLFAGASVASAASQWSQFWDDVNKRHYFYNAVRDFMLACHSEYIGSRCLPLPISCRALASQALMPLRACKVLSACLLYSQLFRDLKH